MKAIRQHAFGGPRELHLEEVPDPHPGDGQVRIRVESAGVHLIDTLIRQGGTAGPPPVPDLPMTPGREVAGVIDEVGPGVGAALLGSRAVADLGSASGGYAELALAQADSVHLLPAGLDADHAVAMIGTGRTTMAILELGAPTAGEVALVTAAAGGIGTLLVQALHGVGATVIGVAGGARKVALARELGVSSAFDYSQSGWPRTIQGELGERTRVSSGNGKSKAVGWASPARSCASAFPSGCKPVGSSPMSSSSGRPAATRRAGGLAGSGPPPFGAWPPGGG